MIGNSYLKLTSIEPINIVVEDTEKNIKQNPFVLNIRYEGRENFKYPDPSKLWMLRKA